MPKERAITSTNKYNYKMLFFIIAIILYVISYYIEKNESKKRKQEEAIIFAEKKAKIFAEKQAKRKAEEKEKIRLAEKEAKIQAEQQARIELENNSYYYEELENGESNIKGPFSLEQMEKLLHRNKISLLTKTKFGYNKKTLNPLKEFKEFTSGLEDFL